MSQKNKFIAGAVCLSVLSAVFAFVTLTMAIETGSSNASLIRELRFNQLVGALGVGAGLAVAGLTLQSYFNNPLASPHILGMISISGVGMALSVVLGLSAVWRFGLSWAGPLVFTLVIYFVKLRRTGMIFFGIFLNFLGDSLIMWIKHLFARLEDYAAIDFWFWGSLEKVTSETRWLYLMTLILIYIITKKSDFLDLLTQGTVQVEQMTICKKSFKKTEMILLFLSSIIIAVTTFTTGKISFVGLMAPHICKNIFKGMNHRKLLILTALCGASILTLSLLIQIILKKTEIGKFPIGLILSVPGLIFFALILVRGKNVSI